MRLTLAALSLLAIVPYPSKTHPARAPEVIRVDARDAGRRFDGLGAVSAGASTRLLFDYPEPARSEILDYLFKPGYGAGLQILKVEIGSDVDATDGAEPSHMRTPTDRDFTRGYEWWLMKEAKRRNPDIVLAGLAWGAPGWMRDGFWSRDNIEYHMAWLDGARANGLQVDYMGGWNESGYQPRWFVMLDSALRVRHPGVGIIGADDLPEYNWRIAGDMARDPDVRAAVDVLGQHSPGGWRSQYQRYASTDTARQLGKPLWASEQSALSHDVGGPPWARGINRAYIDARITASINWAPVSAWYANLPIADTGLLLAEWPWSGYYVVGSTVWAYAHTTQFARPGWRYLDGGCGYLANGASHVALRSPDGRNASVVIEATEATTPADVRVQLTGGLQAEVMYLWSSDLSTDTEADDFVPLGAVRAQDGAFPIRVEPGHVYTLTTTTGQSKGRARPATTVADRMPLPYREDFERYAPGKLARYFSDVNGGFETAPATAGRHGMAYRQVVPTQPISWHLAGGAGVAPTTVLGDPRWGGDYELRSDVLLEEPGYVELIGRLAGQQGRQFAGYHLRFTGDSTWSLYSQELTGVRATDSVLARGRAPFRVGRWHSVALRMRGAEISAVLDGAVVGTVTSGAHTTGNVGLRVSGWQRAQFDDVAIVPTSAERAFVPQREVRVAATSEQAGVVRGDRFVARYVADGRPESFWQSGPDSTRPLPQAVTLDLGRVRRVDALTYQPRIDNGTQGMITRWSVSTSVDGRTFAPAAAGAWPVSTATQTASWRPRAARYVKLAALSGVGGTASAAELNVRLAP